jgi:hypothetical protein
MLSQLTTKWRLAYPMKQWQSPNYEEVSLNCEINSYAPSEI